MLLGGEYNLERLLPR